MDKEKEGGKFEYHVISAINGEDMNSFSIRPLLKVCRRRRAFNSARWRDFIP